jgi:hypothetical protein
MVGKLEVRGDQSFITLVDGAIGKTNRYRRDIVKSKGKAGNSLLGYEVSH